VQVLLHSSQVLFLEVNLNKKCSSWRKYGDSDVFLVHLRKFFQHLFANSIRYNIHEITFLNEISKNGGCISLQPKLRVQETTRLFLRHDFYIYEVSFTERTYFQI